MDINNIVKNTADLAKLKFSDAELEVFSKQFEKIIEYVDSINKIDLSGVEPLTHINNSENYFRDDVAKSGLNINEALMNAPKKNDNFYKVPKVIE